MQVWSGTLSGTLVEWDSKTHEALRKIELPALYNRLQAVTACAEIDGCLWCATGSTIVVIELATGQVAKRNAPLKVERALEMELGDTTLSSSVLSTTVSSTAEEPDVVPFGASANDTIPFSIGGPETRTYVH